MTWSLSASGHLGVGLEHLEAELHDALHKVLSDPRFGLIASHFQGRAVDRLHTAGQAPGEEPASVPTTEVAPQAPAADAAAGKPSTTAAKGG
jgi:hypothetical protein